ncbi:MAG: GNAT family N-acetyltransferase, partial [Bacteroidota bacterium]
GTWNLYLIAVHHNQRSKGIGAALMAQVEKSLTDQGARILIVETSGLEAFARTRKFYRELGYTEEARIREFYSAGDDKVVFWKKL